MKKRTAELILKDPEKFAHHDRVFLNNPVVMQGMGLAPLVVVATTGQNGLMLAAAGDAAAGALPRAGLPAQPPCTPAGRGAYPGAAAKSCCPAHFCTQPAPLWCTWRHIPF